MAHSLAIVGLMAALLSACSESTDRQGEVARRGAEVMSFELDATTHHFDATDDGGVQVVVADDPDDDEQVALVRRHLREEGQRFRQGDFGDPAAVHGHDMPGLAQLRTGAAEVDVRFDVVEAGARLTYTSDDPELVAAIHRWFEAQILDHGSHATGD